MVCDKVRTSTKGWERQVVLDVGSRHARARYLVTRTMGWDGSWDESWDESWDWG